MNTPVLFACESIRTQKGYFVEKRKDGKQMDETKGSKLPKNVKQVGQAGVGQKVYIED